MAIEAKLVWFQELVVLPPVPSSLFGMMLCCRRSGATLVARHNERARARWRRAFHYVCARARALRARALRARARWRWALHRVRWLLRLRLKWHVIGRYLNRPDVLTLTDGLERKLLRTKAGRMD